jgi:hypothetical protein
MGLPSWPARTVGFAFANKITGPGHASIDVDKLAYTTSPAAFFFHDISEHIRGRTHTPYYCIY